MTVLISPVIPEDLPAVLAIARQVNEAQVLPHLNEEGRTTMRDSLEKDLQRLLDTDGWPSLKATLEGDAVGYVAWRDGHFVTSLYVSLAHQGKGIGGRLMDAMIARATEPLVKLRSSVNAVDFYLRYGFTPTGEEQIISGIRFVPMSLELGKQPAFAPNSQSDPLTG